MHGSSTTMTVRLAAEVKERLDRLAEATSRSRSWLAAEAISGYLETQEWQIAEIKGGIRDADAGDFASAHEVAAVFAKWSDAR
jgi:predicted transcriptional regulator